MKNVNSAYSHAPRQPLPPDVTDFCLEGVAESTRRGDLALGSDDNTCTFETGAMILTEGNPADQAYIIETGMVEIFVGSKDDPIQLNTLGPGDIFGEMGLIDDFPRSASARALSPCRCIVISARQISERIAASSPIVKMLMSMALHRNRTYSAYLKEHLHASNSHFIDSVSPQNAYFKSPQYQKIVDDIKLESELQNAIQNQELMLYYQPLYTLSQNRLVGYEALLRWQSRSRGMVTPGQFIHLAEETSLIVPIGAWIIEQACTDLNHFQNQLRAQKGTGHHHELFVSINISVKQFRDATFLDRLLAVTRKYDIAPHQLKLEVTERIFLDQANAIETINHCRAAGFEVALDDFGTGYSSLNYLERCEIDTLKIDQSFTQKICTSERAKLLVSSIIDISRKLGLPTVAEGIETPEQMSFLQDMGCEIGQGFLFSQPVAFPEALALLQTAP